MERAGGAAAQEERRRQLQEYLAAKGKLKRPNAKPYLKDWTNHLNLLPKPLAKPEHVARSREDVVASTAKGVRRDDKPGVPSTCRPGPMQRSSKPPQGAAAPSEQLQKSTRLPSTKPSAQPRGKLPPSTSTRLGARQTKEAAKEPVPAATLPGAPCSLNRGLHERLLCNKENFPGQAPLEHARSSVFDGNSDKRTFAHRAPPVITAKPSQGPKGRTNSHQKREELIQHQLRKSLPGTKDTSQKLSSKTCVLQPPPLQTASRTWPHKKTSAKPESVNMARQPLGKAASALPEGNYKYHSRAPQLKQSAKPPVSSRPQGAPKQGCMKRCSPRLVGSRPRGEAGRKEAKVAPPGHATMARGTGPPAAARGTNSSKTPALERDFKTQRERLQEPVLPPASAQARRVPKTPTPEDRKRQLQEWLASKGKSYKRPPMTLPRKKPPKEKPVCKSRAEEEARPERICLDKINSLLTDCLKLVEEGVPSEELLDMLAHVPHVEKFARFWVCKAKLLARAGPFDVTELYKDAVCAGAVPLQELREVVLQLLKGEGPACPPGQVLGLACPGSPGASDRARSPHPANGATLPFSSLLPGEQPEPPALREATTPSPSGRLHAAETPCVMGKRPPSSSIKLQVLSIPRPKEWLAEGQELKLLTPVRRSQRIERAGSRYPPMLRDHDMVVSSLNDILDAEEEAEFFFRKNEALPEVTEMQILAL